MIRRLVRSSCVALVALALLPSVGHASPGKVKKAAKLQAAYEAGDKVALVEALGVLEEAIAHPKVEGDPAAWAMLGHLRFEAAKEAGDPDGFSSAAKDLAKALQLGAEGDAKDQATGDLKSILGMLFNAATSALDAKRDEEAAKRLVMVMAVRQSLADVGVTVRALEDRILTLAVRISIQESQLDDALTYHQALFEAGTFDPGIASLLAKGLAEADRMDDALALLEAMAEEDAGEPRLLRTHVDLLVAAGKRDAALERIDGQRDNLWRSVSGALLLAELYQVVDAPEQLREAYYRVLEHDEHHVDARVWLAAWLAKEADADQARLDAGDMSWEEKKALTGVIAGKRTEVVALLESTFKDEPNRGDIGALLVAAHRSAGDEEAARAVQEQVDAIPEEKE